MKAIGAVRTHPLNVGTVVTVADNSGAKMARITGVREEREQREDRWQPELQITLKYQSRKDCLR